MFHDLQEIKNGPEDVCLNTKILTRLKGKPST